MLYKHKDLIKEYGSDYKIKNMVKDEVLFKVSNGIYSNKKNNHYLEIFTKKYPQAIISGDSAYYYHNLTDVIPDKIYMTTKRDSSRFKDDNIKQSYSNNDYFELGKTNINYEGNDINIYDKERMLLELVKNKNQTAYDYYKEIIDNYRNIKDELDIYKLQKYSEVYYNGVKLMKMIQDEVF